MRKMIHIAVLLPILTGVLYTQLAPHINLQYCCNSQACCAAKAHSSTGSHDAPLHLQAPSHPVPALNPVVCETISLPLDSQHDPVRTFLTRSNPGRAPPAQ